MIKLVVLGEPKPQPRPRFFKAGEHIRSYDPAKKDKQTFAGILQAQAPKEPISGPISLEMTFYMARPKGHYGTGKNAGILKKNAPEWHTSRGDLDNLIKMGTDSMNKIFYRDDAQIAELFCKKIYSENPRTEIIIVELFKE